MYCPCVKLQLLSFILHDNCLRSVSQSLCDIRELGAQVREPSPQPWQVAKPGVRGEVQKSQCGVRCDLGKAQVLPSKAAEVSE